MANSVFFKTSSKSIYTSNMIKGGGQGSLIVKVLIIQFDRGAIYNSLI